MSQKTLYRPSKISAESGQQRPNNVDQTHLVIARGRLVLQKNDSKETDQVFANNISFNVVQTWLTWTNGSKFLAASFPAKKMQLAAGGRIIRGKNLQLLSNVFSQWGNREL